VAEGRSFEEKIYTDRAAYTERELRDHTGKEQGERLKRGQMDVPFALITLILLVIGVLMVFSASFARAYYINNDPTKYFVRQLLFAVSGVALMLGVSRAPVKLIRTAALPALGAAAVLLVAVLVIGTGPLGVKRWINLGFTTFQPSEFAKMAVVLSFAHLISNYRGKMRTFRYGVLPFAVILGVIALLLIREPHYSATIIILLLGALMMFAGGTHWAWFVVAILVGGAGAYILVDYVKGVMAQGTEAVSHMNYALMRIVSWVDPFFNATDEGWQIIQSLYAVGSGGVTGLGLGQGRQKYLYLPEEHNDFIFSVVCEELGFIGATLIIILFALLIIRGFWLALHTRDRFGSLVITGMTGLLAIQVFFNIAVVTNLVPCTGVSLPFFSYGGTALWIQLIEVGIILSISRDIPLRQSGGDATKTGGGDEL